MLLFFSGSITIDGIDISTIGLDDLRSSISLVPQDAVLFAGELFELLDIVPLAESFTFPLLILSGTIRDNLDPFQEHTDEDLRDALTRVQLGGSTSAGPSRVVSTTDLIKLGREEDSEATLKAESIASGGRISITLDSEVR